MPEYCYNYDSSECEYIGKNGYSIGSGEYVYNWDDSECCRCDEDDAQVSTVITEQYPD